MNHIPRRLFATAILVLLFSGLLTSFSSAALAQGKEEAPGQIKKAASLDELVETDDEVDEEEVELLRIADRPATDATRQQTSSDGARAEADARDRSDSTTEDVDEGCNPQKPNQCHPFVEDPEPVETERATKGPECQDYDQREGPYDHDQCDDTIGLHGNGGNGKCAGCTGLADDKWPGGQYPGDHNNGYECDHNSGVGKGNPPHAKCPEEEVRRPSRRPSRPSQPSRPPQPGEVERPSVPIPAPPDVVRGRPPLRPTLRPGLPIAQQPGALPVTGPRDASIFMFVGVLLIGAGALFVSAESMFARLKRRY